MAERTATASWSGTLAEGGGEVSLESSKILASSPISWQARVEESDGRTSPEELLAGAHAACYAMALSHNLAEQGRSPDSLEVTASCTFGPSGDGFAVTAMKLNVRGSVPGMDEATFRDAARAAEAGCPISNAIRGNVDIELEASLA
jgi:lipoyl-dependent peroxiredoxin